jgi:hypothetical protein
MTSPDEPPVDDRVLELNEAAISVVRREVAAAVADIDRAARRLRQVLEERLPELRALSTEEDGT